MLRVIYHNNQANICNFQLVNKLLHTALHHQRIMVLFVTYLSQSYILHHFLMVLPSNKIPSMSTSFPPFDPSLFAPPHLLLHIFFPFFLCVFLVIRVTCMQVSIVQMRLTAQIWKKRQLRVSGFHLIYLFILGGSRVYEERNRQWTPDSGGPPENTVICPKYITQSFYVHKSKRGEGKRLLCYDTKIKQMQLPSHIQNIK